MTTFLRLVTDEDKSAALSSVCASFRDATEDSRILEVSPNSFLAVPGAPFAYWVSDEVRAAFEQFSPFDCEQRIARVTNPAGDDTRYIRTWWEVSKKEDGRRYQWVDFSKGGSFSPFFYDVHLVVCWSESRQTYYGFTGTEHRPLEKPASLEHFFRPGLTWARRTTSNLSLRVLPRDCIFADKGPAAFIEGDPPESLLALCAIANSRPFAVLVSLQLAAADAAARSYEVGVIQKTPVPDIGSDALSELSSLARRAWSLRRQLSSTDESSHAFLLTPLLRPRLGTYDPSSIGFELAEIQAEIDEIAFELYGFAAADRAAALGAIGSADEDDGDAAEDGDESDEHDDGDESASSVDEKDSLLNWAAGVAFGRFDWRLATGERDATPEPDPFDPLPAKSPGMLLDDAAPFHDHNGILVDDQGHPNDLPRLIEEVLARVQTDVPGDVRRWLQRDFFHLHLKQYSKSRRKAPIYWPLSVISGSYTLWLYYPSLTGQTLYTAVNDFIEPKLKHVGEDVISLRNKGSARTRDDEKEFESLQILETELIEFRDLLLDVAPTYRPNHDDGVQITAAPLWRLFRHKPWQKLLKDTWAKLERGDYDWAHLAIAYWPGRVREKCKTDRSFAIAHSLEELYVESGSKTAKTRQGVK